MNRFENIVKLIYNGVNPYDNFNYSNYKLDLQGWNSEHEFFVDTIALNKPKLLLEVGTWKGGSAVNIIDNAMKNDNDAVLICVDTWLGSSEHWDHNNENHKQLGIIESLNLVNGYPNLYYQYLANMCHKGLQNNVVPLPQTSIGASEIFARLGIKFDFIHIDASHDAVSVYEDIKAYFPLLAEGSVLIGDDINWDSVKAGHDRYCSEHNVSYDIVGPKSIFRK